MREADIVFQAGAFWVFGNVRGWHVMRDGVTSAVSVATFAPDEDGRSLAVAYAKYRGGR